MTDKSTLVSYLIPRLSKQVENAATDALGYILNKSPRSMEALCDLLREGEFDIGPITRVETQVTYEDGSRPDMAGYGRGNVKCLLVEAKFWAALLEDQASGYARQFDYPGPAVLLFIAPELRLSTLWAEIENQMERHSSLQLIDSPPGMRKARVIWTEPGDTDLQLVLVSWIRLLDSMAALAGNGDVGSDIRQLRGLAERIDEGAFLPVHCKELSPDFARRIVGYNRLVDDVVHSRGVPEKWMNTDRLMATPQRWGYGRYFRFSGVASDFWFGVNHERWATNGDTPLWLRADSPVQGSIDDIARVLNVEIHDLWVPIHPKLGAEYTEVVDDVVLQLKAIAKIIGACLTT